MRPSLPTWRALGVSYAPLLCCSDHELHTFLASAAPVKAGRVVKDKMTGQHRGLAYADFEATEVCVCGPLGDLLLEVAGCEATEGLGWWGTDIGMPQCGWGVNVHE